MDRSLTTEGGKTTVLLAAASRDAHGVTQCHPGVSAGRDDRRTRLPLWDVHAGPHWRLFAPFLAFRRFFLRSFLHRHKRRCELRPVRAPGWAQRVSREATDTIVCGSWRSSLTADGLATLDADAACRTSAGEHGTGTSRSRRASSTPSRTGCCMRTRTRGDLVVYISSHWETGIAIGGAAGPSSRTRARRFSSRLLPRTCCARRGSGRGLLPPGAATERRLS